jgi:hypothetical protein
MRSRTLVVAALLAGVVTAASAHDLFIKLHSYFLEPDRNVEVLVLNGTFLGSENSITPDRLLDVSVHDIRAYADGRVGYLRARCVNQGARAGHVWRGLQ